MLFRIGRALTLALLLSGTAGLADRASAQPGNDGGVARTPGPQWVANADKIPDLFTGTWSGAGPGGPGGRKIDVNALSFVEADKSRNVPFTPKAQKYVDSYKHVRDIPYASEGCTTPGPPISMRVGGFSFLYSPGLIAIYQQSTGHTRFVKMDQPQGLTYPKYYGNSVGHWEGNTLVVETVDFNDEITFQYGVGEPLPPSDTVGTVSLGPTPAELLGALSGAIWGPHGEGMRMVERMQLIDANTLKIETTVYDDTVWTKPYVMTPRTYRRRASGIPQEFVCSASITKFDSETNTYTDKDPEEMVKMLDKKKR